MFFELLNKEKNDSKLQGQLSIIKEAVSRLEHGSPISEEEHEALIYIIEDVYRKITGDYHTSIHDIFDNLGRGNFPNRG